MTTSIEKIIDFCFLYFNNKIKEIISLTFTEESLIVKKCAISEIALKTDFV